MSAASKARDWPRGISFAIILGICVAVLFHALVFLRYGIMWNIKVAVGASIALAILIALVVGIAKLLPDMEDS